MTLWLDAQLSPALVATLSAELGVDAVAVRDLGLRDARDPEIWARARKAHAVVMTKDRDFVQLLEQHGPPPQVLWVTCGNTSNAHMHELLRRVGPKAIDLLGQGEPLVEIGDAHPRA
ncbi:MAG: DUF5615 family PIN-like protein [Myxococcota bacterium]